MFECTVEFQVLFDVHGLLGGVLFGVVRVVVLLWRALSM